MKKTAEKKVKAWYVEVLGIPTAVYDQYEAIFCRIVYNTKKGDDLLGSNVDLWSE